MKAKLEPVMEHVGQEQSEIPAGLKKQWSLFKLQHRKTDLVELHRILALQNVVSDWVEDSEGFVNNSIPPRIILHCFLASLLHNSAPSLRTAIPHNAKLCWCPLIQTHLTDWLINIQ